MNTLTIPTSSLTNTEAVIFDVFGTLCFIGHKTNPYRPIFKHWPKEEGGIKAAFRASMVENTSMHDFARRVGVPEAAMQRMDQGLAAEIASIQLFPEVAETLCDLHRRGIRLALASNLAQPYAEPVRRLLPVPFEVEAWSFEVGFMKPEHGIYQHVLQALQLPPHKVLMVGDSKENDAETPHSLGMHSCHLQRL